MSRVWSAWNHKPSWSRVWSAWNHTVSMMAEYDWPVFVWEGNPCYAKKRNNYYSSVPWSNRYFIRAFHFIRRRLIIHAEIYSEIYFSENTHFHNRESMFFIQRHWSNFTTKLCFSEWSETYNWFGYDSERDVIMYQKVRRASNWTKLEKWAISSSVQREVKCCSSPGSQTALRDSSYSSIASTSSIVMFVSVCCFVRRGVRRSSDLPCRGKNRKILNLETWVKHESVFVLEAFPLTSSERLEILILAMINDQCLIYPWIITNDELAKS